MLTLIFFFWILHEGEKKNCSEEDIRVRRHTNKPGIEQNTNQSKHIKLGFLNIVYVEHGYYVGFFFGSHVDLDFLFWIIDHV